MSLRAPLKPGTDIVAIAEIEQLHGAKDRRSPKRGPLSPRRNGLMNPDVERLRFERRRNGVGPPCATALDAVGSKARR